MSGQPLQPITGRTGGGLYARVAALLAFAIFAIAIWAGLSGRDGGTEVTAEPTPPLVVVVRPSPAASHLTSELEPASQPTPAAPVEAASDRLARITRGWYDYGRRDRLLAPGASGTDESHDLTLWSCNDQGLTWASRQDCGSRPSSMSQIPAATRGTR